MNIPGALDLKNQENIAKWMWRRHLQGGTKFWVARDLTDLRDEDLRRRGRLFEFEVGRLLRNRAPVVHIAPARLKKMRRKA